MKKIFVFLSLVAFLSCNQEVSVSKDERMIAALIKIDGYYASNASKVVTERERNETVLSIAKRFNVVVYPITNEEFAAYYSNEAENNQSGKMAAAGCKGQDYTFEGVLEGNGCVGLVRRYSDVVCKL